MIAHSVIFHLGSLEVFRKRNMTLDISAADMPGFYWMDKGTVKEQGPFPSIYQAMEHYAIVLKQRKDMPALHLVRPEAPLVDPTMQHEGKLIHIDFVAKKRIG